MNCRNIRNNIAMYHLCLVSTVQNVIWSESNPICYPFVLTVETLNLFSSKSEPVHPLRIGWYKGIGYREVSWWSNKPWFTLEGLQNFRTKWFFPTKVLNILTKRRIQNFSRMTTFTVNFVTVTLLKPKRRTMLTNSKVDWPPNKP